LHGGAESPSSEAVLSSIGFAGWPDVQLIRHSDQSCERFGLHLEHHPSAVNPNGLFSSAELGARLLVE
jgi:hypothetical protein